MPGRIVGAIGFWRMIEIFSHNLSVRADEEAEGILIISGNGWEGEPFQLYVKTEEAKNLLWQLNFFVGTEE